MKCLRQPLVEVPEGDWYCPDCLQLPKAEIAKRKKRLESLAGVDHEEFLVRKIKQIQSHPHLTEKEKAKIFQELLQETRSSANDDGLAGKGLPVASSQSSLMQKGKSTDEKENTDFYEIFKSQLACEICHQFPVFIVTVIRCQSLLSAFMCTQFDPSSVSSLEVVTLRFNLRALYKD